jgi:hypothetical protein
MTNLVRSAEAAIQAAGYSTIHDCPGYLESALEAMTDLSGRLSNLRAGERELIVKGTSDLKVRLEILGRSLDRSYAIIVGFSHQSGVTSQEYSPAGLAHVSREPSLFMKRF